MIDWVYTRKSVVARRRMAEAIRQKHRELYNGTWVRYTSTTVNLLDAIIARCDRKTARAEVAFSQLMDETGIASKETIARHIYLLETGGYVKVTRAKIRHDRNAINVFELLGEVQVAFTGIDWGKRAAEARQKSAKNRTDIRYDGRTDNNKNTDDDVDIDNTHQKILARAKTILDSDIAEKLVAMRGAEAMGALMDWVEAQAWAKNKAGLLYRKAVSGFVPPVGDEAKTKAKAWSRGQSATKGQADDWRTYLVDVPADAPMVASPPSAERQMPEWLKTFNIFVHSQFVHQRRAKDGRDFWVERDEGQVVVLGYSRVAWGEVERDPFLMRLIHRAWQAMGRAGAELQLVAVVPARVA